MQARHAHRTAGIHRGRIRAGVRDGLPVLFKSSIGIALAHQGIRDCPDQGFRETARKCPYRHERDSGRMLPGHKDDIPEEHYGGLRS